jgi:hypothetical protein
MNLLEFGNINSTTRSSNGQFSFRELESRIFKEEIKDSKSIRENVIKLAKIVKDRSKK